MKSYQNHLGFAISVDQLTSSALSLKPQSTGNLTLIQIVWAQISVDYSSSPSFLFTYLIWNFSLNENLKAKVVFECIAATCNVLMLHYWADNGRFTGDNFIQACIAWNQIVDFYRINTHFQNRITETNIDIL